MGYTIRYICQRIWDLFDKKCGGHIGKIMGYICKKDGIYSETLWDIQGKIMGYTMGYICQKLWDIFIKLWDLFGKTMGYIGQKLWDILG